MPNKILPVAFIERIKKQRPDAEDFLKAIGGEPWLSVRLNPLKKVDIDGLLTADGEVAWCADGRYLTDRPVFTLMPEFHAGAFYVQEASSMSLSVALGVVLPQLPVHPTCLDLCAAPGGKTTLLLSRVGGRGVVVANEIVRQRAWILRENIAKWGNPSAIVTNKTAEQIAASGVMFDLITVDAPCSGEGMFRKDQTAIEEWSPKAADDCAARQREILESVWPALKTGGYVVYSTCTYNPDENERNIEWLASEFGAEVVSLPMPEGQGIETLHTAAGDAYAFYPNKVKGEGLFICLLKKTEASAPAESCKKKKKGCREALSLKEMKIGSVYVEGVKTYQKGDEIVGFPNSLAPMMVSITEALDPLWAGVAIGNVLKKRDTSVFTPAAELPLSVAFKHGAMVELAFSKEQALKYLHGDADLQIPEGVEDGWCVVSYGGLRLGLVKKIGARLNNYYPKEWRIKMNVG